MIDLLLALAVVILRGTKGYYNDSLGWIRVYGYGIHFKDNRVHRPLFAERNGYIKFIKLGTWRIGTLKP